MQPFDPQSIVPTFDTKISNYTCEAYGCCNRVSDQVTVKAGKLGYIDLNLCNSCVPMFKNTDELTAVEKQLTVDRMAGPNDLSLSTT